MFPRKGGDPDWAPAFAGEQGSRGCFHVCSASLHRRLLPHPPPRRRPGSSWKGGNNEGPSSFSNVPQSDPGLRRGGGSVEGPQCKESGAGWRYKREGSPCLIVLPRRREPSLDPRLRGETTRASPSQITPPGNQPQGYPPYAPRSPSGAPPASSSQHHTPKPPAPSAAAGSHPRSARSSPRRPAPGHPPESR